MTGIDSLDYIVLGTISCIEIMRSDGKALQTDTEDLTFETILHHGLFLLEDLIERLLEEMTVHHVVHTLVLTAVVYPKVHDTGVILCLAHGIGNVTATLGVLDPEIADSLIGIGQRKVAALGVREAGAVEIQLGVVGLGPVDPTLEVLDGHLRRCYELHQGNRPYSGCHH